MGDECGGGGGCKSKGQELGFRENENAGWKRTVSTESSAPLSLLER